MTAFPALQFVYGSLVGIAAQELDQQSAGQTACTGGRPHLAVGPSTQVLISYPRR
jgi:hypothetical protein